MLITPSSRVRHKRAQGITKTMVIQVMGKPVAEVQSRETGWKKALPQCIRFFPHLATPKSLTA